jgi:hypothetical protein
MVPSADIASVVRRLGRVPCPAEAGHIWLYATTILHASERARRPRRRRVLHVDYAQSELPRGLQWLGIVERRSFTDA